MKKKVFSIILTVTMLVSMLSFFSLSTGALQEWDYVSPGGDIIFPTYTYYYEFILTGFQRGGTQDVTLYVPSDGYVLIQSFGPISAYAPALTLWNFSKTEILCQGSNANQSFKGCGANGNQTLFQFYSDDSVYKLSVKSSTSEDVRLSITIVSGPFIAPPLISDYTQIKDMDHDYLHEYWVPGQTYTFVGRRTYAETGWKPITTIGCESMITYVINTRSTTPYDRYVIYGEVEQNLYFEAGTYYVVVLIPEGDTHYDPMFLTVVL